MSYQQAQQTEVMHPNRCAIRGVRNSKESRTLARESILESQIRIKNHRK
jgi:hypothetical protein